MEADYLKNFTKRMTKKGAYALLFRNSIQKGTWKKYGFEQFYEQTNLIFTVLLFIMEQSLKEDNCTMDDIGSFIDSVNMQWFHKNLSFRECRELGDFIINTVLCDEGKAMYFKGYDFEKSDYEDISISFIHNKIIYLDGDIRRTSYYLTDEGYQLMLSTLEIESNMMLTVQEMIFKLHLEKASYDQAVEDIKNIFNRFRIQLQKIKETMQKIRQNALLYSLQDYRTILEENLGIIEDTKKKFLGYREHVKQKVLELEERDIHIKKLGLEEEQNLKNLKTIELYLNRAIDEHQKILSSHLDLKFLYTKELEDLSQMALIKRFQLRSEVYDKVLSDANLLENIHLFLSPLFSQELPKTYNLNKSLEVQKPIKEKQQDDEKQVFDVEDEEWKEEMERRYQFQQLQYKECLEVIYHYTYQHRKLKLEQVKEFITEDEIKNNNTNTSLFSKLIPTVEIFKEVIVELLKEKELDLEALKVEQKNHISEKKPGLQLAITSLAIFEEHKEWRNIHSVLVYREDFVNEVIFENCKSEIGGVKKIRCSNITFEIKVR